MAENKQKLLQRLYNNLVVDVSLKAGMPLMPAPVRMALTGAGIGAAAGAITGSEGDRTVGALRGAVAGGVAGATASHLTREALGDTIAYYTKTQDLREKKNALVGAIKKIETSFIKTPAHKQKVVDLKDSLNALSEELARAEKGLPARHKAWRDVGRALEPTSYSTLKVPLALGALAGAAGYGATKAIGPQTLKEVTGDIRMDKVASESFWDGFEKRANAGVLKAVGRNTFFRNAQATALRGARTASKAIKPYAASTGQWVQKNPLKATAAGVGALGTSAAVGRWTAPSQPQQP
jgi:hypothetical protein